MVQVIDQASLQAAARQGTRERILRFEIGGEMRELPYRVQDGQIILPAETRKKILVGEIGAVASLQSLTGIEQLTGRIALDVEIGREQVSLLYKPIYDAITDPNFPQTVDGKWALRGVVVFAQVLELEEIKYGTFEAEKGPGSQILTFAAMLAVTRQMIDFNQSWNVTEVARAYGEAYNALLNNLHLGPILTFNYQSANITANVAAGTGNPAWLGVYNTLAAGLKAAAAAKRKANILLVSEVYRGDVEMAIRGGHQIAGSVYPPLAIDTVIYYDGWEISQKGKTISYPGCGADYGYLLRGKRGFKELIKRDLVTEQVAGDASRMIDDIWRGYCYRGNYAAVANNVQRVDLSE